MKLYRQVSTTERLPEKEGVYPVVIEPLGDIFMASYNGQYSFHEEFTDCSGVTHWLEELPELPTEEEIKQSCADTIHPFDSYEFSRGANYIINLIKNK